MNTSKTKYYTNPPIGGDHIFKQEMLQTGFPTMWLLVSFPIMSLIRLTFLFSIPFLPNMQSPKSINVLGYNVIHITCCYLRKQHTCREDNFCYIEGVIYKAHQIKTTQHNNILTLFTLTILLSLYQCFPSQLRKEIKRLCVVE